MKLEIRTATNPIDELGKFEPAKMEWEIDREVYIDGKRAPKFIEEIILLGMDVKMLIEVKANQEYLNKHPYLKKLKID